MAPKYKASANKPATKEPKSSKPRKSQKSTRVSNDEASKPLRNQQQSPYTKKRKSDEIDKIVTKRRKSKEKEKFYTSMLVEEVEEKYALRTPESTSMYDMYYEKMPSDFAGELSRRLEEWLSRVESNSTDATEDEHGSGV